MELHHTRKKTLIHNSRTYHCLSDDNKLFLNRIEKYNGDLSDGKWRKLFSILAELTVSSGKNYRVYKDSKGLLYDTTAYKVVTQQELDDEIYIQDITSGMRKSQRLKFEINVVERKIRKLKKIRIELSRRLSECES